MRHRQLRGLAAVFLLLLLIVLLPVDRAKGAQVDPADEILQLVNNYRASQGLPPFQYNSALTSAAQRHASWMAANVIYSHTGEGGSTPATRAAAAGYVGYVVENIVGGTSMSPRQGLIWWQNSPIHHNTLVSSRYIEAGTGFASNGTQNMYVLLVGRPSDGSSQPATESADSSAEPLIITPITLAEPREDGSIVHVIQQGQAMWTIAAYYDVDLDYLYLINNLTEDDVLHPGDAVTVRLAEGASPPPSPTPPMTYLIRQGDSAWSIAGQFGISVEDLYWFNNLDADTILQPGDEVTVRLPEGQPPPPTPTPRTTHIVREGQSPWTIAALYGLTVDQLLALNGLSADSVLRPGDELVVRQPTATPIPTATSTPAQPQIVTPDPQAVVLNEKSAASPTAPSSGGEQVLADGSLAATRPAINSQPPNQPAADGGQNWLVIIGVALAVGGILALFSARRSRR